MEKEEKLEEIAQAWKGVLYAVPKEPKCLLDKVELMIMDNPQQALEQNILDNNNDFWRKVYDKRTRGQNHKSSAGHS